MVFLYSIHSFSWEGLKLFWERSCLNLQCLIFLTINFKLVILLMYTSSFSRLSYSSIFSNSNVFYTYREPQSATSASPSPTRKPSLAAPSVTPPVNLSIVLSGPNICSISCSVKAILIRWGIFQKRSFSTFLCVPYVCNR